MEFDTSGLASSESFLIATAFLILFIAFPPTLAVFARLLGLDWLDDTENSTHKVNIRKNNKDIFAHKMIFLVLTY